MNHGTDPAAKGLSSGIESAKETFADVRQRLTKLLHDLENDRAELTRATCLTPDEQAQGLRAIAKVIAAAAEVSRALEAG